MERLVLVVLAACACPTKPSATPVATPATTAGQPQTCDGMRHKVEQLYRAEAQAKEPKRVEDATADNTAMVMADCAKDPAHVMACLGQAQTVADIEKQCLAPLDEEGSEGAKR